MPFKQMLTELVQSTTGGTGAILADREGESVEQYSLCDPYQLKVTAAHWGIVFERTRGLHEQYPLGSITESVITTDEQHVLVGAVGGDYTLVVTLNRSAPALEALHHFRRGIELLKKEIY